MHGGRREPRTGWTRWAPAAPLLLAVMLTAALAAKPSGDNVHRPGSDCRVCHTADAATLNADPATARTALGPDLAARCDKCHGDQGPSHKTDIKPVRAEPPALPLASDGTIGCATCHFMHGENNAFGNFLRIDNSRGALCLSCHELSELQ